MSSEYKALSHYKEAAGEQYFEKHRHEWLGKRKHFVFSVWWVCAACGKDRNGSGAELVSHRRIRYLRSLSGGNA